MAVKSAHVVRLCVVIFSVSLIWWSVRDVRQVHTSQFARMMELTEFEPFLEFLNKQPHDERCGKVIGRLRTLLETQNHVQLEISQHQPGWESKPLPIEKDVVKLCSYTRIREVSFEISCSGEGLSGVYRLRSLIPGGESVLYTGARLSGQILVRDGRGSLVKEKSFRGEFEPPKSVQGGSDSPSGAPFGNVYSASFLPTIAAILGEISGARAMIPALWDENASLRSVAAEEILTRKDPATVGALIGSLREGASNAQANDTAVEVLHGLTGRNFGSDVSAWQAWWRENKRSIQH